MSLTTQLPRADGLYVGACAHSSHGGKESLATFAELSSENPGIRAPYGEWREARSQNGEDPVDYQAFRQHVTALGGADPGDMEIDDFVGDDFKAANPDRYPTFSPSV